MQKIPFFKPSVDDAEIDEVVETLRSGWLTTGPKTKQFEREFAAYIGQGHAVAVNSCTAALHLALEAIGLKAGQGVVVPTMTFAATAEVVRYFGARPLLVDCRPEDFNLDVANAERTIQRAIDAGQSVVAIMPVHYGGQIGDVQGIAALAKRYGLKIVEDAAHCCPAFYRPVQAESVPISHGQCPPSELRTDSEPRSLTTDHRSLITDHWLPVGHSADITCFSFYANKCITTGEGGMACTNHDAYADRMRIMSLHGISRDAWKRYTDEGSWYYEIIAPGYKYNLTDVAAAMGIHQLRKAAALHRLRTQWADLYSQLLAEVEEVVVPRQQPNRIHSWHLYPIRLKLDRLKIDRAQFILELQTRGISTSVHWMPLHLHPYYRETYGYVADQFPVATALYPEIITLPLYPAMTEADVRQVGQAVADVSMTRRAVSR